MYLLTPIHAGITIYQLLQKRIKNIILLFITFVSLEHILFYWFKTCYKIKINMLYM